MNKSKRSFSASRITPSISERPVRPGPASIRHALEIDAWRHDPQFAARMSKRSRLRKPKRRSLRWQDRSLLIIGIILLALVLLRIETARADDIEWGLELNAGGTATTQLALNTDVRVEVTGLIARVEVTQLFSNPGDQWAEAIYRFPLPGGAAVDRLAIQVGERIIEGEIREKKSARRVYEQAVQDGFTASLVAQQKANQFETRLANIGPGEEIRVTIGFLVNVNFEQGAFSLRLPMTFTPRWDPAVEPAGRAVTPTPVLVSAQIRAGHHLSMEVLIRTGIGFAAIESRYHDVDIQPTEQGYQISLVEGAALTDRDFELAWLPDLQAVPQSALMTWDGGDAIYAQLMMVPPLPGAIKSQPREVIFIIDTSGSMEGESMRQAKSALLGGLEELQEYDLFNLVQFNSDTEALFTMSVPVTQPNLVEARHYIDSLVANGGTVMAPALHAAFSFPGQPGLLRQVIFVTDGSVGNEKELLAAIAEDLGDSRLFTVSIGSAPNSWFMRKAAEIGRGSHTHIGNLAEVELRMSRLWSHIRLPALSNICVDWGPDAEYYPEIIPDLYAGEPLWIVARLPLQPNQITICGLLNGQYWEQHNAPFISQGTDTLATLWARRKIESLEDGLVFGADPDLTRTQITQVALDYGLLTAHTSLVAVDRTMVRMNDEPLATGSIPGLLPAGSSQAVSFAQTATGWKTRLLLSIFTMLIATGMFYFSGARLPLATSTKAAR